MKRSHIDRAYAINALCVVTIAILFLLHAGLAGAETQFYKGKPAKYILFFIGDGMGIPQRSATEAFTGKKLAMDTLPAQGITTTYANDRFITGSAASATAMACGQKTNINYIGVDPDYKAVKTIAEMAKEQGKKVGIISSVSIDHATPAAFYAHVKTRKMYYEIGLALANSNFDFFGGGGLLDPAGKKSKAPRGDVLEIAKKNGYTTVSKKSEFMKLTPKAGKVIACNEWLQDSEAMPYSIDARENDISLAEFTAKAIEVLDNPDGFFLMVEGGKIDWACHANDATAALEDTIAFDDAVKEGLKFYQQHPEETLIVVSGDHECGGLTLGFAGTKYASNYDVLGKQKLSFQKFSDENIKKYRETCGTACKFEDIKPMITESFGLKFEGDPSSDQMVLEPYQVTQIQEAFQRSLAGEEEKSKDSTTYLLYGGYDPLAVTLTHILNSKAGLGWTSYSHTGVPVSTSAIGAGSEVFNGYYDNTDIALKVMSVMGLPAEVQHVDQKVAAAN